MDYNKYRKCSSFIDKAHAVATVACLEAHFERITALLDSIEVQKVRYGDEKLTVKQRVEILARAFDKYVDGNTILADNYLYESLEEIVDDDDPDFCPEELNAAICDEDEPEVQRLALVGSAVEEMPPNSALFKHNDDTWTWRSCIMDAVWDLRAHGYTGMPEGSGNMRTAAKALEYSAAKALE